ncbi:MAG: uncharacterized protein KVP18_002055 [Porospora cf. gigantea A]|uniref:uncharacterized protein n=1 Tax=Porospora cf. gigantea A TaxID=2853593 RepID=UPI003559CB7E|nr:MAG: hypothetical protein KVP18_002055 [Porospora cf. gigantea A]
MSVTVALASLLWSTVVFAPLKLVAVFLHESSHALMTVITGGKVKGIEISENFGGFVKSSGGSRGLILSAGYVGSVLWGGFFLVCTVTRPSLYVGTVLYILACVGAVLVLRIHDKTCCGCRVGYGIVLRVIILLLAAIPAAFWALEENVDMPWLHGVSLLRICLLIIGSVTVMTATYDCLHDVLFKKYSDPNNKSDAVMFAEEYGGAARCWGLLWSLISLAALAGSCFLILWLDR